MTKSLKRDIIYKLEMRGSMDILTKTIFEALTKLKYKQINLNSEAARKEVAEQVAKQIREKL